MLQKHMICAGCVKGWDGNNAAGKRRFAPETTTCCMLGEKAERNERTEMNSSSKERNVSERALFEKSSLMLHHSKVYFEAHVL